MTAKRHDALIVGARCAGAALATRLARGGIDVVMIDRDTFPSDTLSTHVIWPNGVAALDRIGALERLRERHQVPELQQRFRILGREIAGGFTAVDGFDHATAPRRLALDAALVDTALAAGAEGRFGQKVVRLLGEGSTHEPVRGVRLENGERIEAEWVFGADGRGSKVAGALGLDKQQPLGGEMAYLLATWTGLPPAATPWPTSRPTGACGGFPARTEPTCWCSAAART
jgi:2-polyprenyl-6-methoxyphenol hydroxylase-like FAD-dependent oxidoreductase